MFQPVSRFELAQTRGHLLRCLNPYFDPERECLVVILLNTRRRVKGHQLVTIGTMDTLLVHSREVFRLAVVACAAAVVIMHNHPSGELRIIFPSQNPSALSNTHNRLSGLIFPDLLEVQDRNRRDT